MIHNLKVEGSKQFDRKTHLTHAEMRSKASDRRKEKTNFSRSQLK